MWNQWLSFKFCQCLLFISFHLFILHCHRSIGQQISQFALFVVMIEICFTFLIFDHFIPWQWMSILWCVSRLCQILYVFGLQPFIFVQFCLGDKGCVGSKFFVHSSHQYHVNGFKIVALHTALRELVKQFCFTLFYKCFLRSKRSWFVKKHISMHFIILNVFECICLSSFFNNSLFLKKHYIHSHFYN